MKQSNGQSILIILFLILNINQVDAQNYFSQNTTTGLPTLIYNFDVADLENDGDLDILVSTYSNVYIYTNNGSGSFTLLSGTAFSSVTYEEAKVKFIDIDGDNDQDVLIVSTTIGSNSASQLYRNDGGSTYTLMNSFPTVDMLYARIAVGDLDNDNDNDIIIAGSIHNNSSQLFTPFINDGNGNFTTNLVYISGYPWEKNGFNQIPIITELNGDNANDIVGTRFAKDLAVHVNNSTKDILVGAQVSDVNENAVVADLDGDGDKDIVGNLGVTNYILFNDGAANFTQSSQTLNAGKDIGCFAADDVDNDGDIDILRKGINAASNGYLGGLYLNDSKANFYLNNDVTLPDVFRGTSMFVDLNGDNYPELLICNELNDNFYYYDNTYLTNLPDKALDFDGTNNYTTNNETALNSLPMTIEFWVQDGSASVAGLINNMIDNNGFQVGMAYGGVSVDYKLDINNYMFLNQVYHITDGNWHHIAIVIESTGMKLYANGVEHATTNWVGTAGTISNTTGLSLGNWSLTTDKFTGNLDELRIWNTARSQAEIVNNMCANISNPRNEASLVAYYSMNDYVNGHNILFDESSNNNTMTISGGSQVLVAEQVGCSAPALPVEFVSFTGTVQNNDAILKWITATEENNQGFEIERSTDGLTWENIGFVQGNGTTSEISEYEFVDNKVLNSNNYYRLKQSDLDGSFEYSNIVNLTMKQWNDETVKLFPNPVSDILNIETTQPTTLQITNTIGQIVKEANINSTTTISVKDLSAGIYIIKVGNQTQKIIKK